MVDIKRPISKYTENQNNLTCYIQLHSNIFLEQRWQEWSAREISVVLIILYYMMFNDFLSKEFHIINKE